MVKQAVIKLKSVDREFILFLLVGAFLGLAQSVDGSTFNNFLKDKFHMLILQRSALELPRELPGFLVVVVIGFLYALGDVRIAVVANLLAAAGMFLMGVIPPQYSLVLICLFIYSTGQHVYMPINNSIGMKFAKDGKLGRKLGQLSAANTAAMVAGSAILFIVFKFVKVSYTVTFTAGAIAFLGAAGLLMLMKPDKHTVTPKRFVFRKEYKVFYILSALYGGRKQIYITFGAWVIVDVFKQKVATMTMLFFITAVISIAFKPLIGHLIDRVGERFVLSAEAFIVFFVCLGYSYADALLPAQWAVVLICALYVLDQLFNAAAMARATYLKKIAVREEDVSPTLSLGTSIDHIMSMSLPFIGGIIWYGNGPHGYRIVFLAGAVIAILNFVAARFVRTDKITA